MGNTLGVSASDEKVPFIKRRDQVGNEVDRPDTGVRFLEPDPLIDERINEMEQALPRANVPAPSRA